MQSCWYEAVYFLAVIFILELRLGIKSNIMPVKKIPIDAGDIALLFSQQIDQLCRDNSNIPPLAC